MDKQNYYLVNQQQINLKYSELKKLRDDGQLIPGYQYRITDYVTTTSQPNTKSANNCFDIIVTAMTENTLDHKATASRNAGDAFFNDNKLGDWLLWYDLDNDTTKYGWADPVNGKGVIYRLIDDEMNDCYYDFKNILTQKSTTVYGDGWYYTFSYVYQGIPIDGTEDSRVQKCAGNIIKPCYSLDGSLRLPENVFICSNFYETVYNNVLGFSCTDNVFEETCIENILQSNCRNNHFYRANSNYLSPHCNSNKTGEYCDSNYFEAYCASNFLELHCARNVFANACYGQRLYKGSYGNYIDSTVSNTLESISYRKITHRNRDQVNLDDEYYDDGSGQLVPIKHPDLSTQPSILPYKFMGQYVYEQLIPKSALRIQGSAVSTISDMYNVIAVEKPIFLEACHIGSNGALQQSVVEKYDDDETYYFLSPLTNTAYLRIVYTSMPEEEGYYGYNTY